MKTQRMFVARLAALGAVALLATACASEYRDAKEAARENAAYDDFGRSVRQDIAAQVADPDAVYKTRRPPTDGKRMDLAQRRYQANGVLQSEISTTTIGHIGDKTTGGSAAPAANDAATSSLP